MLVEQRGAMRQATMNSVGTEGDSSALEVQIRLVGGIGVSVINSVPEELVFINLAQIQVGTLFCFSKAKVLVLETSLLFVCQCRVSHVYCLIRTYQNKLK